MPINNLTHFVLVDFENVPGIDLSVLGNHPMIVTLFLGPKSKLKATLVEQITSMPFEVRLIKIGQTKKNALDFLLAYHLGEMVTRYPRGHYYIISGDQDFAPLIVHLREHSLHVSQHGNLADLPFLVQAKSITTPPKTETAKPSAATQTAAPAPPVKPVVIAKPSVVPVASITAPKSVKAAKSTDVKNVVPVREAKIIARLKNQNNRARPETEKGLRAHLKNSLGKQATTVAVDSLVVRLRKERILEIDSGGKVCYPPS